MTKIVLRPWPVAFPCPYEWGTGVLDTGEGQGILIDRDMGTHDCALLTAASNGMCMRFWGVFVSLKHYFIGPCNLQHENLARVGFYQSAGSKATIAYCGLGWKSQTQTCKS